MYYAMTIKIMNIIKFSIYGLWLKYVIQMHATIMYLSVFIASCSNRNVGRFVPSVPETLESSSPCLLATFKLKMRIHILHSTGSLEKLAITHPVKKCPAFEKYLA
jgi:hypothetical protein